MCLFYHSRLVYPPPDLALTTIFARPGVPARQWLAYSVRTHLFDRVNLVIPLPTPPGTVAGDLRLFSLHDFPEFFEQLDRSFPRKPPELVQTRGVPIPAERQSATSVHALGEYSAMVASTLDDLTSVDETIRPPAEMLRSLRGYRDFAFVVLNLRPRRRRIIHAPEELGKPEDHHAILIDFPTRHRGEIFIPMLSAPNGSIATEADYDHKLYCQTTGNRRPRAGWEMSSHPVGSLVDKNRDFGAVDASRSVFRKRVKGQLPNADLVLEDPP